MNKFKRYLRIVRLINEGRAKNLSTEDYRFFKEFTLNEKEVGDLLQSDVYKSLPDAEKKLYVANIAAFHTPEFKEDILMRGEDIEKGELAERITAGLNVALSTLDLNTSIGQLKAGERAQRSLKRPSRPAPLAEEPLLDKAIADASKGDEDALRSLSPAQSQILDQYLSDINQAKTVSAGQAGIYGALGQVASTRRGRQSAGLVPLYDEIVRNRDQRFDGLVGQKIAQNQAIQQSKAQYYPTDVYQYGLDASAAGNLVNAGQQNLRSTLTGIGSFLPALTAELTTRRRFRDIYNKGLGYDEDNARFMAETDYRFRNADAGLSDPDYYRNLVNIYNGN
jgi:hypothetical protein